MAHELTCQHCGDHESMVDPSRFDRPGLVALDEAQYPYCLDCDTETTEERDRLLAAIAAQSAEAGLTD